MMSDQTAPPNTRVLPDGKIEVLPRAIATITAHAVLQCYGVVGMAPRNLREGVAQVLHREDQHKGIEVHIGEDEIAIDLYVIIEYGTRIVEVARNVQENVQYAVERALGLPVSRVNVRVQGVRISDM
ncbi:MAG: Asp23/Gls24 family envelope stress response protein [Chloroflexales bacterium]|nr:Asp23/Gls24 family envelope stress response protein [Chloroflexales bacterium]